MFQIIKKSSKSSARVGIITTPHGEVKTPCFMPIATKGAVKNLTPEELKFLGADLILGNTYHLWLRPGVKVINKVGGLHKFMNWSGPILTDSGGYQVFSLENKVKSQKSKVKNLSQNSKGYKNNSLSLVKIADRGVEFRDPFDGKTYFLTPEKAIEIQLKLGSDIIMVLDECPPYPCTREQAKKAVHRTTEWARRCKKFFIKHVTCNLKHEKRPLLFGIIQGSVYQGLRIKAIRDLLAIGFSAKGGPASGWDGYAIGGVAVGEPRQYLAKILKWVIPLLPEDKPCYLMGLGRPEEIVEAVKLGIDLFDCVIPTREARHGRLYLWKNPKSEIPARHRLTPQALAGGRNPKKIRNPKSKNKNWEFYEMINILNSKYKNDSNPINQTNLKSYSRAYLHHLFKMGEPLAQRLATLNNLEFYLSLMVNLRQAVKIDKI
ncbi:MAG: tRNA guanosine(34) transglycosylase Tgt [bacterium]